LRCAFFGILFAALIAVSAAFADGTGLLNPAEKEFASDSEKPASFAKKSPVFADRMLPPQPVRQVSEETPADPWANPVSPPANQPVPFSTPNTAAFPTVQSYHQFVPNNAAPYFDPNTYPQMGGYYPQTVQPQVIPYQTNAVYGMNPYGLGMSPYGAVAEPYGMTDMNDQTAYQANYQAMPDYNSVYQAMLMQEMMRRQTEIAQGEKSKTENQANEAEEKEKEANANWTVNNLMPVRVSSPLGETLFACAKTMSPFCSPEGPDKGVGMPLVGKSWLDHPYYFGGFVGSMSGSDLVAGMIKQKSGGHGGMLFGYNFNDYWGLESRLHFSAIDIYDTDYAKQLLMDTGYTSIASRTNELTIFDVAVQHYPLGNAKWRPYVKYGLGIGHETYVNTFGNKIAADVVTMPLGAGLRYWWNEQIAIQADLIDNVVFASGGTKTQNNVAFTVGLTYSFGTSKKKHPVYYWPATPSMGSKW
jgi:hypothetical protein